MVRRLNYSPSYKHSNLVVSFLLATSLYPWYTLFSLGKPRPLGGVRVLWLCLKNVLEIAISLLLHNNVKPN